MPWCPECESEYEDYVKVCKSCNVELVADLEAVVKYAHLVTIHENELDRAVEYLRYSGFEDIDVDLAEEGHEIRVPEEDLAKAKKFFGVYIKQRQEELAEMAEKEIEDEENREEEVDEIFGHINMPQKEMINEEKIKDVNASVWSFLLVGGVILIVGLLGILNIVRIFSATSMNGMLVVMGCLFVGVGLSTRKKLPSYKAEITRTKSNIEEIVTWFNEQHGLDQFYLEQGIDPESLDSGALYFAAADALKLCLSEKFPDQDENIIQEAIDQIIVVE